MRSPTPIISLFSGPGGMDLGFRQAGFEVVFAADFDKASVDTYNRNSEKQVAHCLDLAEIKNSKLIDLVEKQLKSVRPRGVIGGPPCQAFSLANVAPKRNDPRKRLLARYAEILALLNSRFDLDFFVFENVGGIKLKRNIRFFRRTVRQFQNAGFNVFETELDAFQFGVAQKRRRVFVVGFNSRRFPCLPFEFPLGVPGNPKTVKDVIGRLNAPAFYSRGLAKKSIPEHINHWAMQPKSRKFSTAFSKPGRSFRRLEWDKPSWTVAYGNREMHVHPSGRRRVSVFEAMLLQGFPESYQLHGSFSEQVSQVSNAVPPPLAHAIAEKIRYRLYDLPVRIQDLLTDWQRRNGRIFPWRRTSDLYKLLVAEKLLQQTAASSEVLKAYSTLIGNYPTVKALSSARLETIREIFQPLGLQYRANELLKLARHIRRQHRSRVPESLLELLKLPGIGDYSARALLCFGRGKRIPIVDANIARFLIRFFALPIAMPTNPARHRGLRELADHLVPEKCPGTFNFALLDLCASACTARSPKCSKCPLRTECAFAIIAENNRHTKPNAA
jgi:DNA (cytosine-5)-methyltransferase 1